MVNREGWAMAGQGGVETRKGRGRSPPSRIGTHVMARTGAVFCKKDGQEGLGL